MSATRRHMPVKPETVRAISSVRNDTLRTLSSSFLSEGAVAAVSEPAAHSFAWLTNCAIISARNQPANGTPMHQTAQKLQILALLTGDGRPEPGRENPSAAADSAPAAKQIGSTQATIK